MNRLRFYLLGIAALMCCMSASAQKYEFVENGIIYEIDLNISITDAKVIGHTNAMPADVVIPETVSYNGQTFNVTSIGNKAFYKCKGLKSIDLGNVKTIENGENTFVKMYEEYWGPFAGCTALTSMDFKNVKTIGDFAFRGCTRLTSINFSNVTTIGWGAFSECTGLRSIDFKNVKTLDNFAFSSCNSLTSIDFKNVITLNDSAFENCTGLTSIDLKNVKTLGGHAFENCTSLTSINFKDVSTIGYYAFRGCTGLTSINLKNATNVKDESFVGCTKIKEVKISATDTPFLGADSFDPWVYAFAKLYVPFGCRQKYAGHEIWGKFKNIEEYSVR